MSNKEIKKAEKYKRAQSNARPIDFKKYEVVKMALRFSYMGENYGGLVLQQNDPNTVEQAILTAFRKVCLIDPHEPDCFNYKLNRCGRTDKGVSALGNVMSLSIKRLKDEDYLVRMNRCLPPDIRMLQWAEVGDSFDARFSCVYREYNYFFI